jgi:hypothetical protein
MKLASHPRTAVTLFAGAFAASLLLASCIGDGRNHGPLPYETALVHGTIVLPPGASVDLSPYRVVSTAGSAAIQASQFQVPMVDDTEHRVLFVADAGERVLMMKVFAGKAGQREAGPIDATSTAVALALLRPWLAHMTEPVRAEAEAAVRGHAAFGTLVQAVSAHVAAGDDLFGAACADLGPAVEAILTDLAPKVPEAHAVSVGPLAISGEGGSLRFENVGHKSHAHVIGLYDQGSRVEQVDVLGENFAPGSLFELGEWLVGKLTPAGKPEAVQVDMPADTITLHVRTGWKLDGSDEASRAYGLNMAILIRDALDVISLGKFVGGSDECLKTVAEFAQEKTTAFWDPSGKATGAEIVGAWLQATTKGIASLGEACGPLVGKHEAIALLGRAFTYVDIYGNAAGFTNTMMHFQDWSLSPAAADFCARSADGAVDLSTGACLDCRTAIDTVQSAGATCGDIDASTSTYFDAQRDATCTPERAASWQCLAACISSVSSSVWCGPADSPAAAAATACVEACPPPPAP